MIDLYYFLPAIPVAALLGLVGLALGWRRLSQIVRDCLISKVKQAILIDLLRQELEKEKRKRA